MNRLLNSCSLTLLLGLIIICPQSSLAADYSSVDAEEANLRSITFIDPDRGWAAGDRGIILHTQDGGLSWQHQPAPSSVDLTQIAFYNSQRGLAVGGGYRLHSRLSVGEVLTTRDGGATWQSAKEHNLPLIRKLLIGRGGLCVAAGDWSSVYSSNLFVSKNGGETWEPIACDMPGNVIDLAGTSDDFLVLSDRGQLCRVRDQSTCTALVPPDSLTTPREQRSTWRLLLSKPGQWWLVSPMAVIASSAAGNGWQPLAASPLTQTLQQAAVAGATYAWTDDLLCVATNQGTELLSYDNAGSIVKQTTVTSRIHSLCHFDSQRLWACGDFGAIMSSRDGGKSWRQVRGQHVNVALLIVSNDPVALPWNLLATESLQGNRRVGIALFQPTSRRRSTIEDAVKQAANRLGPSVTFRLSIDDESLSKPEVESQLDAQIQACLQAARPAVVVLDADLPSSIKDRWAALSLDQGVKRLLERSDRLGQTIHVSAAIPDAGALSSDYWHDAQAMISPGANLPSKLALNARFDSTGALSLSDGLAGFVARDPQYAITRKSLPSRRNLQLLQARSLETSWKNGLLNSVQDIETYQRGLESVLTRMQPQNRDRMWVELCEATNRQPLPYAYLRTLRYLQTLGSEANMSQVGRSGILSEAASRDGGPLGESSWASGVSTADLPKLAAWRLQVIANSHEWTHAFGSAIHADMANQALHPSSLDQGSSVKLSVDWSPFQNQPVGSSGDADASMVSQASYLDSGTTAGSPIKPASAVNAVRSNELDLYWNTQPLVLQQQERSEDGELGQGGRGPRATSLNKPLVTDNLPCAVATERPYLDGKFDESWWPAATSLRLPGFGTDASCRIASDSEFVYFAISVPHRGSSLEPTTQQRDMELSGQHRYRLRLDLDQDLSTAYEFEFDGIGNTRDCCDGFVDFDPRWYLASHVEGQTQQVEIAIQRVDLGEVGRTAAEPSRWFGSLDLLVPQQQSQNLSLPDASQWFGFRLP